MQNAVLDSMRENSFPAYTETDILGTILEFKKNMEAEHQNQLSWKVQSTGLLFMGNCPLTNHKSQITNT